MTQRTRRGIAPLAVATLLVVGGAACTSERVAAPARELKPPVLRVVSPTDSGYDLDGDSLVDLELAWTDSGDAVRAAGARVRALTGVNGPGGDTVNLLDHWHVERRDASGLLAHETLDYLLHGGPNRLEVTVPDTAGNVAVDTVTFTLPYAALVKTIASGITDGLPATGIALCADDHRVYMPVQGALVIVDADSQRLVRVVPQRYPGFQLWNPLCSPGDPILYVTSDYALQRFNRPTGLWLPQVPPYGSDGIAQSRAEPDLLYIGWAGGIIGIVSRSAGSAVGSLIPLNLLGSYGYFISSLAVPANGTKVYAAEYYDGVWVVDRRRNIVLDSISVGDSSYYGEVQSLALTRDDSRLYAAVTYGYPRGLAEIDTRTDRRARTLSINPWAGIRLALSPDEQRIFLTTQDANGQQSSNVLIDIPTWRVIQYLPRPRPAGSGRMDVGVVFHPDGRHIFVTHDRDLDIYLNRP